jgi:hypothetical protein
MGASLCELYSSSALWGDSNVDGIIKYMEAAKPPLALKASSINKTTKGMLNCCLDYKPRERPTATQLVSMLK